MRYTRIATDLTRFCAERFAPGYEDPFNINARARIGVLEGWVSVVLNTAMAAGKFWIAAFTGSISLLADAAHTLSDTLTSVVVILGFRAARRPPDTEHPFGHGRVEQVASLIIGVLLAVTGVEMGRAAVMRVLNPQLVVASMPAIVVVSVMMLLKEWLARFSFGLGRLIDSRALAADAWHHRSDAIATALVVLGFVAGRYNIGWADGLAGIGVAGVIVWAAWKIVRESADPLVGVPAPEGLRDRLHEAVATVPGVIGVHALKVHQFGVRYDCSMHVRVSAELKVGDAHRIATDAERVIRSVFPGTAAVHVDPAIKDSVEEDER